MSEFRKISTAEWTENPFRLIGQDFMLLTATDLAGNSNPMTASWGGVGVLWNLPVAFLFIRPQRHTHSLAQTGERFTASFFPEEYRSMLTYMGKHSGRDGDKAAACHLTPAKDEHGAVYYEEARLVLSLRKLYAAPLKEECFFLPSLLAHYPKKDYHTVYVTEITEILQK